MSPFSTWNKDPKGHPIRGCKEQFLFPIFNVLQTPPSVYQYVMSPNLFYAHLLYKKISNFCARKRRTRQPIGERKPNGRHRWCRARHCNLPRSLWGFGLSRIENYFRTLRFFIEQKSLLLRRTWKKKNYSRNNNKNRKPKIHWDWKISE